MYLKARAPTSRTAREDPDGGVPESGEYCCSSLHDAATILSEHQLASMIAGSFIPTLRLVVASPVCVYIYIYIYIDREREIERER